MIGRVTSVKMQHSATVIVVGKRTHKLYKKSFVYSKKYLVDDPLNVKLGDIVMIEKTRPISKRKHFLITKVLGQDIVSLEQAELQHEVDEAIAEVIPEEKEGKESSVISNQSSDNDDKAEAEVVKKSKKSRVKTGEK